MSDPTSGATTCPRPTVLVVDDEESLRTLFGRALERHGFRVLVAVDAAEALALAARADDPIDVLVTDVILPGGNGIELARALRAARPALCVIQVSGFPAPDDALVDGGRARFLLKPFGPDALVRAIRDSLVARP